MARQALPQPANPGGAATATLFDEDPNNIGARSGMRRVIVFAYLSHTATFNHKVYTKGSTTGRVVNGGGIGEQIAATTAFTRACFLYPGRNVLEIVTGTANTTWEVEAATSDDQAPPF